MSKSLSIFLTLAFVSGILVVLYYGLTVQSMVHKQENDVQLIDNFQIKNKILK